jgi:predicted nucleotidyltransferase
MNSNEILEIKDRIVNAIPIDRLYLFGSYANGNPNEDSDYDFYMVVPDNSIRPVDAIHTAYIAMRDMKRNAVDILAGTTEVFNRRCKQLTLEQKIYKEGIVLYEREG